MSENNQENTLIDPIPNSGVIEGILSGQAQTPATSGSWGNGGGEENLSEGVSDEQIAAAQALLAGWDAKVDEGQVQQFWNMVETIPTSILGIPTPEVQQLFAECCAIYQDLHNAKKRLEGMLLLASKTVQTNVQPTRSNRRDTASKDLASHRRSFTDASDQELEVLSIEEFRELYGVILADGVWSPNALLMFQSAFDLVGNRLIAKGLVPKDISTPAAAFKWFIGILDITASNNSPDRYAETLDPTTIAFYGQGINELRLGDYTDPEAVRLIIHELGHVLAQRTNIYDLVTGMYAVSAGIPLPRLADVLLGEDEYLLRGSYNDPTSVISNERAADAFLIWVYDLQLSGDDGDIQAFQTFIQGGNYVAGTSLGIEQWVLNTQGFSYRLAQIADAIDQILNGLQP